MIVRYRGSATRAMRPRVPRNGRQVQSSTPPTPLVRQTPLRPAAGRPPRLRGGKRVTRPRRRPSRRHDQARTTWFQPSALEGKLPWRLATFRCVHRKADEGGIPGRIRPRRTPRGACLGGAKRQEISLPGRGSLPTNADRRRRCGGSRTRLRGFVVRPRQDLPHGWDHGHCADLWPGDGNLFGSIAGWWIARARQQSDSAHTEMLIAQSHSDAATAGAEEVPRRSGPGPRQHQRHPHEGSYCRRRRQRYPPEHGRRSPSATPRWNGRERSPQRPESRP